MAAPKVAKPILIGYVCGSETKSHLTAREDKLVRFTKIFGFALFGLTMVSNIVIAKDNEKPPLVFAASSLTTVLTEHALNWSETRGLPIPRLSFGASAAMARQIKAGAPAHIFISANPRWVETITNDNRVEDTAAVAINQLVLVGSAMSPAMNYKKKAADEPFEPTEAYFSRLLKGKRLALANPALAPLGAYSLRYLQKTMLWDFLNDKIAYGQNARQTLRLVEQGGLPAFVYRSDAFMNDKVTVLYAVPSELSGSIIYQAALLKTASSTSKAFFHYLQSEEARPTWVTFGFGRNKKIASK